MKCNLNNREELISKYLISELSDEESLNFEEHYFSCNVCFNELKATEQSLNLIAKEAADAFKAVKVKSKISFLPALSFPGKIGFAFAGIALLFALYIIVKNYSSDNINTPKIITEEQTDKTITSDSSGNTIELPINKEKNLIAELSGAEFKENAYYEEWINETVRSGNILIDKVLLPRNNDKYVNQSVMFKWSMNENIPVNLVIMNNDDDIVFYTKVLTENFPEYSTSVKEREFKKSGLYYWRIEDEIEVLYLGKFYFVKKK